MGSGDNRRMSAKTKGKKRTAAQAKQSLATFPSQLKAESELARMDQTAVTRALQKQRTHSLTNAEQRLVRRYTDAREVLQRFQFYRSIPQKHVREMAGITTQQLNDQAERYGLAFGGPVLDLVALLRSLRVFLAKHSHKFADTDDGLLGGENSPALERYRDERAKLARLERLEREGKLLPRDRVHEGLSRLAVVLRQAGDVLQRQFGTEPAAVLEEALTDYEQEVSDWLNDNSDARKTA